MAEQPNVALIDMEKAGQTPAYPADDIRGRPVYDRDDTKLGDVDGVLIDEQENKVRFLSVGSGGFLGIGKTKRLIPVDAITRVDEHGVHIEKNRDDIAGSPAYDPEIVPDVDYYAGLYSYYAYPPFWAAPPAYIYPYLPYLAQPDRPEDDSERPSHTPQ